MERISLAEQQRSMALKEENNVNYSPGSTVVCRLQLHLSASSQWIDRSVRAANLILNVWRGDGVKRREGIRFHGSDPIRWLGTRERNVGRARPVGATPTDRPVPVAHLPVPVPPPPDVQRPARGIPCHGSAAAAAARRSPIHKESLFLTGDRKGGLLLLART